MLTPLSALIVEDSASDAALAVRQLVEAGFQVNRLVVEDADGLRAALQKQSWDVVLADFSLPGFDAGEALGIVQQSGQDIPFIVVSGVIGDERAIELMRCGASDYVLKDNLARLGEAVRREIKGARQRDRLVASQVALRHSEQERDLLATALNSATVPIAICNDLGLIVWINAAFTAGTGLDPSVAPGRELCDLLDWQGDGPGLFCEDSGVALRDGRPWSSETVIRSTDGTEHPYFVTLTPVRRGTGKVTHFIAAMHDLSAQRAMESRLQESQRLESIGQLTGGIAHDFNNLLTVILGNSELLAEQLRGNARLEPLAEMIATAADRGADLTRALLAFARKQELAPQPVDINQLVASMQPLLQRALGEHIEVHVLAQPDLGAALIDAAQLESALLNLCLNARDAMGTGGRLTIETGARQLGAEHARRDLELAPGEYVMVAVTDTGSGIAREHMPRLFEPFFTTKEQGKGTGLGLPRVYGFIKQSGGQISVQSEVGSGSTFELYLPRVPEYSPGAKEPAGGNTAGGDGADGQTILLVEDDEQVRNFASQLLADLGYRVLTATAGPSAMALIQQHDDIDLLFTDMVMPGGMQGSQLAAAARLVRPDLKVLYTSGYTDTLVLDGLKNNPDFRLLWKPYRRSDLAAAVREALGGAPQAAN